MGFSSDKMANNTSPQETLVKELDLPCSNSKSIRGNRNIRLLIPINNALKKLSQQNKTAGEHWSLLKCDIQASDKGEVKVQFGHFDSIHNSSNGEVSDVVASKIYEVSFFCLFFIWYVLIISLT